MIGLFIATVGLGLAYCATPGAVNTESLRRGMVRGFWPALLVQLGSLIGDLLWAQIALTGLAISLRNDSLRLVLGVAGGCFLLRLAWKAVGATQLGARRETVPGAGEASGRGDFLTGAFFSLANPFALAFWLGMGSGVAATAASSARGESLVVFIAGFALGALLWCVAAAAAFAWGRRLLRPAIVRWIDVACGAALGYFGLRLLWQTVRSLRNLRWLRLLLA